MLVERYVLFLFVIIELVVFVRIQPGENEELVLTAKAELTLVVIQSAAGLTKHSGDFLG
jgi:hypothetical protein